MTDAPPSIFERRPLLCAAWIALKLALVIATLWCLAEADRAAVLYQRF